MSNSFCKFLSNGLHIAKSKNGDGYEVGPCCFYNAKGYVAPDLSKVSIENIRNKFINVDTWTASCETCKHQEDQNGHSYRLSSQPFAGQGITSLEIMLHNVCGAACMICDPVSSSEWHKQYKSAGKTATISPYMFDKKQMDFIFEQDLSNLRRIKFYGGEPLLNDLHVKFLERIPNKSKCDVHYTTSGQCVMKSNAYNALEEFNLVKLEFSIDGTLEQNDYLRYPLIWNDYVNNLKTIKQDCPNNFMFAFNHTLNPFNAYYFNRVEKWIQEEFSSNRLGDPVDLNVHPCWGNMGLEKIPQQLAKLSADKTKNSQVKGLLANLSYTDHNDMIAYCDFWDMQRNVNWRNIFPEIVSYF